MVYNVQTMSTKRSTKLHRFFIIFPAIVLMFVSCGGRPEGFGIVRWSPEEELVASGDLVPVYEESAVNGTYTIGIPQTKKRLSLEMWRIDYYKRKKDAEEAARRYSEWANKIGVVENDGLPIREEPEAEALRLYKLRINQKIKILSRQDPAVIEDGLTDHWYKVLTDDGTIGYCFGYFLTITPIGTDTTVRTETKTLPRIEEILSKEWRPESYRTMIDQNRIDLERFTAGYGLFPYPEKKQIRLVNENRDILFTYSDIETNATGDYTFIDTTLQIDSISESKIEITYFLEDTKYMQTFVDLTIAVEEVIHEEKLRRKKIYETLTEEGNILTSSAYGTITLKKGGEFTWEDYRKLVPQIIPVDAGEGGTIEFSLFLEKELKQKYDGAVSFHFEGVPPEKRTDFLFVRENGGVKFYYVPPDDIEEKVIMKENPFPIIIFFTVQG